MVYLDFGNIGYPSLGEQSFLNQQNFSHLDLDISLGLQDIFHSGMKALC